MEQLSPPVFIFGMSDIQFRATWAALKRFVNLGWPQRQGR